MRIDAHQHFWRYSASEYGWIDDSMGVLRRDFLPPDAETEMARAGLDACVAVQVRQTLEETRWLLSLADRHRSIVGVVGWVDLQSPDVHAQLVELRSHPRLVGVRHIVQSEADDRFLLRSEFCRGISHLEELDLAYDILIYRRHLRVAAEFASRFPRTRFVLDHLAKPDIKGGDLTGWADDLRALAAHPNVVAKLSGLVTEADWRFWRPDQIEPYLDVALECFGANRLMIGSDWPVCTVAADYARTMNVVIDYVSKLSAAERDAVLGGTARRFWRLDETRGVPPRAAAHARGLV